VTTWAEVLWLWSPAAGAAVSAVALVMTVVNLRLLRRPTAAPAHDTRASVAVCIPARNEEANLGAAVGSALASRGVELEVLVYDDESTDRTPALLRELVADDPRVRAVPTRPLPAGWNGKQWACQRMGEAARAEWLLFTDADVRLEPGCLAAALDEARALQAVLLSTVPRQETGSLAERLVVPLIHWMLLSWLPMPRMRRTNDPATSAGCGQFLLVRADAWRRAGGHAAFRASMHDGIMLPRALRRAGLHTDLFDGTALVRCRMYRGAREVWRGFTKNAYEGLGSPVVLVVFSLLEGLTLLPWMWLAWAAAVAVAQGGGALPQATPIAVAAIAMQWLQRALLARRFRQPWSGALLHPAGLAALLAIQWWSAWLHARGARAWRGRGYGRAVPPGATTAGS
jgi:hypothetical protein